MTTPATVYGSHDDDALRLDRLLAGSSLHRFRCPRRNSVRCARLVHGRNNSIAFPRLGHLYAMTPLVFPAASTGARCVSNNDFHGSPLEALRSPAEIFAESSSRLATHIVGGLASARSSKHFQQEHLKSLSSGIAECPHLLQMNLPSDRAIICLNSSSETQWGHGTTVAVMAIFIPHVCFGPKSRLRWILPGGDYRNVKMRSWAT